MSYNKSTRIKSRPHQCQQQQQQIPLNILNNNNKSNNNNYVYRKTEHIELKANLETAATEFAAA